MSAGVYAIEHVLTGRVYIGSTTDTARRWSKHKRELNAGCHLNPHLQAAWSLYGASAFLFCLIESVPDRTRLFEREQVWLDAAFSGQVECFNVCPLAGRFSAEQIEKIAAAKRGKPRSTATREKISAARKGVKRKTPMSLEGRANLSAALKGRRKTPEHCAKISAARKGWVPSEITKARIAATKAAKAAELQMLKDLVRDVICKYF